MSDLQDGVYKVLSLLREDQRESDKRFHMIYKDINEIKAVLASRSPKPLKSSILGESGASEECTECACCPDGATHTHLTTSVDGSIQPNPDGTCSRGCEHWREWDDVFGKCKLGPWHTPPKTELWDKCEEFSPRYCPIAYKILEDVARAARKECEFGAGLTNRIANALSRVTWIDWSE